jgi:hypothetical protein
LILAGLRISLKRIAAPTFHLTVSEVVPQDGKKKIVTPRAAAGNSQDNLKMQL